MKLLDLSCPNCGAKMSLNMETKECTCNSCGGTFLLDDETQKQQIDSESAAEAGYQFEMGRQKAQSEVRANNLRTSQSSYGNTRNNKKKTNIWLWIIGFLLIFPVPVTILVSRSKKMSNKTKIIIIACTWLFYLLIGLGGMGNRTTSNNIRSLTLTRTTDIEMTVGDAPYASNVLANVKRRADFAPDNVVFVSENPDVATINYTYDALIVYLYFEIIPVSEGETYIYAMSADGTVMSERVRVIVNGLTEVESISLDDDYSISLGESVTLSPDILPDDAADKSVVWTSSDNNVVTVSDDGQVVGVGSGEAIVTATTSNGLSDTCSITVDASRRVLNLSIDRQRDDDNNIGDEWSHIREINGEAVSNGPYTVAVGDTLTFYVNDTEEDDVPDVGEATVTYIVTEDDFENGFVVELEVYATENGGPNSGQSAHFITTFTFEIQ